MILSSYRYCYIAETGKIEGLHRFRNLVKFNPALALRYAAEMATLNF